MVLRQDQFDGVLLFEKSHHERAQDNRPIGSVPHSIISVRPLRNVHLYYGSCQNHDSGGYSQDHDAVFRGL